LLATLSFTIDILLALDPLSPDIVYAAARWAFSVPPLFIHSVTVYKSADGGVSWVAGAAVSGRASALVVHPTTPNTLYVAGSTGLLKSDDGGATWSQWWNAYSLLSIAVGGLVPATLWAGTSLNGTFASVEGTGAWIGANQGLVATLISSLSVHPFRANVVYSAVSGNGILKSIDGGVTWSPTAPLLHASAVAADGSAPSTVWAGASIPGRTTPSGALYRSDDGGSTWQPLSHGSVGGIQEIAIDPGDSSRVYVAAGNVAFTVDGGGTWHTHFLGANILTVAIDPVTPTTIYAGGSRFPVTESQLFKSTDGGVTWSELPLSMGMGGVTSIAVDPFQPSTVYVSGTNGVGKSVNGGLSWHAAADGLWPLAVNTVVIDPSAPLTLYAGTDAGVFRTTNGGESWAPFNDGLVMKRVRAIAVPATPHQKRLFVGTDGGGVFWRQPPTPSFDHDPRADFAIYRASTGQWFIGRSFDGGTTTAKFGDPSLGDVPVPADYDCDGRRDLAFYRTATGEWHILQSSTGRVVVRPFGDPSLGDIPIPGRYWNFACSTDIGLYRATTGQWFVRNAAYQFGSPAHGDIPVAADYDGDGITDLAVYRTTTGDWFVAGSSTGVRGPLRFGAPEAGDVPVPADYDGDGKADLAVYRRSTGEWFIFGSSMGFRPAIRFGAPSLGDTPVPADYDGDGMADIAVYRTSTGEWFGFGSSDGAFGPLLFGSPALGDVPVTAPVR
jgi:photosystem II stability/assembly factor-like uncharacterized protein